MNTSAPQTLPAHLTVTVTLARLLERLDHSAVPVDAEQYRSVAGRLADELRGVPADPVLFAVLDAFPAASQVYENLNYQHAGLCRAPLERSLNSELQAHQLLQRVARQGAAG